MLACLLDHYKADSRHSILRSLRPHDLDTFGFCFVGQEVRQQAFRQESLMGLNSLECRCELRLLIGSVVLLPEGEKVWQDRVTADL